MKLIHISTLITLLLFAACTESEPGVEINDENFPFRLQYDSEEGAALADAEDYSIEIEFADFIGDLPAEEITLSYELSGEGDFANASIDEVIYEYEDDDCVFVREVAFDESTITIPVDADLGTVPEGIEIVLAFNLASSEASDGEIAFEVTGVISPENVLFNAINTFEYEILDNDFAGEWVAVLADENDFLGPISTDLAGLSFSEINPDLELTFEFEFEEMKIEIELTEEEEVTECEDGEVETEIENVVIEIEAEYDAEDGEFEWEGSYFNEDGEELDFLAAGDYTIEPGGNIVLTITNIVNEDGDVLFDGSYTLTLEED